MYPVTTFKNVTPIDALLVINEINSRQISDPRTGSLPSTVPDDTTFPFLDTTCDSHVTPLDALLVINAINIGQHDPSWSFQASGSTNGSDKLACRRAVRPN